MGAYTVYTLTKSREILCLFKCEKCNHTNLYKIKISGQGRYDDRNAGFRRATVQNRMAERSEEASSLATDQLEDNIANLELNLSVGVLMKAGIRCKCNKCSKMPWWTMSKLNLLKVLAKWISILALIFAVLTYGNYGAAVFLAIPAVLLCWGAFWGYWKFCEHQFENRTPPIFADSLEKLRERKDNYIEYKDVSI